MPGYSNRPVVGPNAINQNNHSFPDNLEFQLIHPFILSMESSFLIPFRHHKKWTLLPFEEKSWGSNVQNNV